MPQTGDILLIIFINWSLMLCKWLLNTEWTRRMSTEWRFAFNHKKVCIASCDRCEHQILSNNEINQCKLLFCTNWMRVVHQFDSLCNKLIACDEKGRWGWWMFSHLFSWQTISSNFTQKCRKHTENCKISQVLSYVGNILFRSTWSPYSNQFPPILGSLIE